MPGPFLALLNCIASFLKRLVPWHRGQEYQDATDGPSPEELRQDPKSLAHQRHKLGIIFLPPHRLLGNAAYGRLLYQRCALRMRYALGGLQYIMLNQNQWHLASAGSLPDYKLYRRDRGPFVYLVADAVSH